MKGLSLEDMLEVLQSPAPSAAGDDDEGFTAHEIAEAMGLSKSAVRQKLAAMKDKLDVGWRRGYRVDGQKARIPCYRLREGQ